MKLYEVSYDCAGEHAYFPSRREAFDFARAKSREGDPLDRVTVDRVQVANVNRKLLCRILAGEGGWCAKRDRVARFVKGRMRPPTEE